MSSLPTFLHILITLPAGSDVKYCDEYICLWVCLRVCLSVCLSTRISPEPLSRSLSNFCAYVRGSVLLRHVYDRPHRLSPARGFLLHWKCIIGQERVWKCTARAKYAICYCLVYFCYYLLISISIITQMNALFTLYLVDKPRPEDTQARHTYSMAGRKMP